MTTETTIDRHEAWPIATSSPARCANCGEPVTPSAMARLGWRHEQDTLNPRRAIVRYRVTVYATVDLDAGTVESVTEDMDSIRKDGLGIVEQDGDTILTAADMRRAVQIAEAEEWPAWDR